MERYDKFFILWILKELQKQDYICIKQMVCNDTHKGQFSGNKVLN